ncbi:N-ethylmaleimide reductase [compost metagenome]
MTSLFTAFELGDTSLSNRIVMAPMTRSRADSATLVPTQAMQTYYEQRASAGLIISEGIVISEMATGYINVPGLYTQEQIGAWSNVTQRVHAQGGKIFAQLWHVGRISHPDVLKGNLPLAPSAINANFFCFTQKGMTDTATPKAMSIEEIQQTINDFKQAAINAMAAGFDGVELHAANAYLLHQFLATSANQRSDSYGGSVENRARLLFEVLDAVVAAIGVERTAIRLNPDLHRVVGIDVDDETRRTFEHVITRLDSYALAYLHLTGFTIEESGDPAQAILDTARHYREVYRGSLMINGWLDRDRGNQAIAEGLADLVAYGRPFIANPDLVQRFQRDLPLATADTTKFYEGGDSGFIDYPVAD